MPRSPNSPSADTTTRRWVPLRSAPASRSRPSISASARRAGSWRTSSATPSWAARATARSDRPMRPRSGRAPCQSRTAPFPRPLRRDGASCLRTHLGDQRCGTIGVRVRSVSGRMVGAKRGAPTRRMRADGAGPRRPRLASSRLSVEEAADVLATTLSPQSFLSFTVDRGWTVEHLGSWLKDALPRLLLVSRVASS